MQNTTTPQPRTRCGATRRDGQPCTNPPITGATRCRMHGGSSPRSKAAAKRRLALADAQRAAAKWALPPVDNPLQAMSELAGEIKGWSDHVRSKLDDLEDDLTLSGFDKFGQAYEQVRALVDLYTRLLGEQRKMLDTLGRQKVDERLLAIRATQRELIINVFVNVFEEIGLEGEAMEQARRVAHDRLRSLPEAS